MAKQRLILCVLLVTLCLAVPAMGTTTTPITKPASTWLYVGGSGPGNYTTIQAAVDAAVDGDTVFVYHDASPYHEKVIIQHSISLLGEQPQTTIIDGDDVIAALVSIVADHVTVSGFTMTGANFAAMNITSNDNVVSHLILEKNSIGARICGVAGVQRILSNTVEDSSFINNSIGVACAGTGGTLIALHISV